MEPPVAAPPLVAPVSQPSKADAPQPEPTIVLDPLVLHPSSTKTNASSIKTINIFDFDGTLFRSPAPSYGLWAKESIGKLKSEPSQGGLGWYQDVLTLSEPYVPVAPDDRWWIQSVVDEVRTSIASASCVTVLLTGRTVAYLSLLTALVQGKGLCFDHTLLKPLGGLRTFDFKRAAIRQLLQRYPNTTTLHIHEDREEHGLRFRELLAALKPLTGEVHMVMDGNADTNLPKAQELALATALLARYAQGQLELAEQVEYSCVLLDKPSHALLRDRFPSPEGWHTRAHHMTINMGALHPAAGVSLGTEVALSVVAVGRSSLAYAVKVQCAAVKSANSIPHITLAFAPEGHARDSNDITEWRDATDEEKVELRGVVAEMKKWSLNAVKRVTKPTPGVNIGALVRTVHPTAAGPAIGAMVRQVQTWLKERTDNTPADEAAITAFLKELPSPSSPTPPSPTTPTPSAVLTTATATVTVTVAAGVAEVSATTTHSVTTAVSAVNTTP